MSWNKKQIREETKQEFLNRECLKLILKKNKKFSSLRK